jgi:rhamnosyltransferase
MRQADVCAVIVTFNPDPARLLRVLQRTCTQVAKIILVDNGSAAPALAHLREAAEAYAAELLDLGANLGVAAGHNRGIAWASRNGCRYVLLLDQDSIPAPHMVAQLLGAHSALQARGLRIAAVGPDYRVGDQQALVFVRFGCCLFQRVAAGAGAEGDWIQVDFLISSGSLLALAAVREIGLMEEGLFIDHVDTEWFLRARSLGYLAFGVPEAVMEHELGEGSSRLWLGRWRNVPRYRPDRYYYIFRNSVLLYRRHYAPGQWIRNDLVRLIGLFFYLLLLRSPRLQNASYIGRGLLDGWRGHNGPLSRQ